MKLWCVKCKWEKKVNSPEDVSICPTCNSAEDVYLNTGMPVCRVCGETTIPTSASNLGATWDCPKGHYREGWSKYGGCYYVADGRHHRIEHRDWDDVAMALIALKKTLVREPF